MRIPRNDLITMTCWVGLTFVIGNANFVVTAILNTINEIAS